jgi:hypothetical protein
MNFKKNHDILSIRDLFGGGSSDRATAEQAQALSSNHSVGGVRLILDSKTKIGRN